MLSIISVHSVKSTTMRMKSKCTDNLFITPYHMPVIMHVYVICQTELN